VGSLPPSRFELRPVLYPRHGRSTETRGEPDHLAVEAVVAVMAACFAGVAFIRAAREPAHPRRPPAHLMKGSTPAGCVTLQPSSR
jgi:hypothetical protein